MRHATLQACYHGSMRLNKRSSAKPRSLISPNPPSHSTTSSDLAPPSRIKSDQISRNSRLGARAMLRFCRTDAPSTCQDDAAFGENRRRAERSTMADRPLTRWFQPLSPLGRLLGIAPRFVELTMRSEASARRLRCGAGMLDSRDFIPSYPPTTRSSASSSFRWPSRLSPSRLRVSKVVHPSGRSASRIASARAASARLPPACPGSAGPAKLARSPARAEPSSGFTFLAAIKSRRRRSASGQREAIHRRRKASSRPSVFRSAGPSVFRAAGSIASQIAIASPARPAAR